MDDEQTIRPSELMNRLDDILLVLRSIHDLLERRLQVTDSFQDNLLRDVKEIEYVVKTISNKK